MSIRFKNLYFSIIYIIFVFFLTGNEVVSSLALQMSLYFNVIFCPVWLATIFFLLYLKYDQLSMLYRLINVTVLVLVSVIECLRLYLGYIGNLGEKVITHILSLQN
uniref:Transmembrane protein 17 n=1 Tax=Cacopsylla melanoneura TaxID=428564 RepID=A0A8D8PM25_9HEMI